MSDIKHVVSEKTKEISNEVSQKIIDDASISNPFLNYFDTISKDPSAVDENNNNSSNLFVESCQALLRSYLLQEYLQRLQIATESGSTSGIRPMQLTSDRVIRLCDSFLLGSSSERLSGNSWSLFTCLYLYCCYIVILYLKLLHIVIEHLHFYGEHMSQHQLQESFYMIYEPELLTCQHMFKLVTLASEKRYKNKNKLLLKNIELSELKSTSKSWKKLNKQFLRFANGYAYLLDVLEINTKARCIFAWSGR